MMVMLVRMRGRRLTKVAARHLFWLLFLPGGGAALAVDPAGVAVDVVLLLPDGHAVLHFIDDEAAGAEGLVAMRGTDAHPHGDFAECQRAHAVHAGGAGDAEPADGFFDDARAFLLGELGEGLVLQ